MYMGLLFSTSWIPRFVLNMGEEIRDAWKQKQHLLSNYYVPDNHEGWEEDMSQVEKAMWREMGQFYSDTQVQTPGPNFYNVI